MLIYFLIYLAMFRVNSRFHHALKFTLIFIISDEKRAMSLLPVIYLQIKLQITRRFNYNQLLTHNIYLSLEIHKKYK